MVKNKIKLQDLTIKHNFMFCAVMMDPEICRPMLERILGIEISRVEVDHERCFMYNPEYKSVVLDIYAKDQDNTHYNVEMQMVRKEALPRRARYYHSQMDMELLESGCEYRDLPNTYVIFICDFDPFGEGKYRYVCGTYCQETKKMIPDGCQTIFLNTVGRYPKEVPEELVSFLKYVHAGLEESQKVWEDVYIQKLQNRVNEIKSSRAMRGVYMHIREAFGDEFAILEQELKQRLQKEKAEFEQSQQKEKEVFEKETLERLTKTFEEKEKQDQLEIQLKLFHAQILRCLAQKGAVSENVKEKINSEKNLTVLDRWFSYALTCENIEAFMKQIASDMSC